MESHSSDASFDVKLNFIDPHAEARYFSHVLLIIRSGFAELTQAQCRVEAEHLGREKQLEQLRSTAMNEKFFRRVDEALRNSVDRRLEPPPNFGGRPGEPVPEVHPEDLKTLWQIEKDVQATHPGQSVAVGRDLMIQACKPGANIEAVSYRAMTLGWELPNKVHHSM
jgi:hypothetical protein